MKKSIAFFLIISLFVSLFSPGISANDGRKTGIKIKDILQKNIEGDIVSYAEGCYYSEKCFESLPRTLEAWVYLPSNVISQDCGVIFGSYSGYAKDVYINYEIAANGVPKMVFGDMNKEKHEFRFESAAIGANVWTHVAFVYGGGSISCYINGELKQQYSGNDWRQIQDSFSENKFALAGDLSALNARHFKGELGDVVIYSDIRKAETIANDMLSPDTSDRSMLAYYKLFDAENRQDVPDQSGNGYDMYYCKTFTSESEMNSLRTKDESTYAYSIAFIPDTQYTTAYNPTKLHYIYDFLIENAKSRNIKYVISLGDMTDQNTALEWELVKSQTDRLNGIVPYTVLRGNHDTTRNDGALLFDEYYSKKDGYYYNHVKENGGFYNEDSVTSTYLLFNAGNTDYMILNLDYGASDNTLAWADSVIRQHPEHRVIVATHAYLSNDGTTISKGESGTTEGYHPSDGSPSNDGEEIWNDLLRHHENIAMVVCGHMYSDRILIEQACGTSQNTVYQILINGQVPDSLMKGLGLVAMMYFTEDGSVAAIEYYSTVFNAYFKNGSSRIKLKLPSNRPVPVPSEPKSKTNTTMIILISCAAVAVAGGGVSLAIVFARKKKRQKTTDC